MAELGSGGGSGYPGALDTDDSLESGSTSARADVPNDLAAAIIAIQTELGTDPAGTTTNVKTFLLVDHDADGTHSANITLTTPTITSFANAGHDHADVAGGAVLTLYSPQLQTETATTSGTEHDYTGIASTVSRITIMFAGVSTDGTSIPMIQLGDAGGFETSGYLGSATVATDDSNHNTGFHITGSTIASSVYHGRIVLTLEDSTNNVWAVSGLLGRSDSAAVSFMAGTKALTATLTQIRLTTVNGTDAFDAGAINITLESGG